MDYKETKELEINVKIKNEADKIYRDFLSNIKLPVSGYHEGKFKIWNDSHNSIYVYIIQNYFVFECCFLHEHYVVEVTPEALFNKIKSDNRGIGHLKSRIAQAAKRNQQ